MRWSFESVVAFGSFPILCAGHLIILQLSGYRLFAGGVVSMLAVDVPVDGGVLDINGSLEGRIVDIYSRILSALTWFVGSCSFRCPSLCWVEPGIIEKCMFESIVLGGKGPDLRCGSELDVS